MKRGTPSSHRRQVVVVYRGGRKAHWSTGSTTTHNPIGRKMCGYFFAAPKAFHPLEELFLELLAEDDVDEDVDGGVEGD